MTWSGDLITVPRCAIELVEFGQVVDDAGAGTTYDGHAATFPVSRGDIDHKFDPAP